MKVVICMILPIQSKDYCNRMTLSCQMLLFKLRKLTRYFHFIFGLNWMASCLKHLLFSNFKFFYEKQFQIMILRDYQFSHSNYQSNLTISSPTCGVHLSSSDWSTRIITWYCTSLKFPYERFVQFPFSET